MIGQLETAQKRLREVNEQIKEARDIAARSPARAAWAAQREEDLYEKKNKIYARFNKRYDERVGRTK